MLRARAFRFLVVPFLVVFAIAHGIEPQLLAQTPYENFESGSRSYKAGRYQEAVQFFRAANAFQQKSETFGWIGDCYLALKQYDNAIANYTSAISLNDFNAPTTNPVAARISVHGNRGLSYMESHRYREAEQDFAKVLTFDPKHTTALFLQGRALNNLGQSKQAIVSISKALEHGYSDRALALHVRGIGYFRTGEYQRALEHFAEATNLDPVNSVAYENRLVLLLTTGNFSQAIDEAELDLDRDGTLDQRSQYMAIYGHLAYRASGNDRGAQAILDEVSARCDQREWPYPIIRYLYKSLTSNGIADLATDLGKKTEVHAILSVCHALDNKPESSEASAKWIVKGGDRGFLEWDLSSEQLKRGTFTPSNGRTATVQLQYYPVSQRTYPGRPLETELGARPRAAPDVDPLPLAKP